MIVMHFKKSPPQPLPPIKPPNPPSVSNSTSPRQSNDKGNGVGVWSSVR